MTTYKIKASYNYYLNNPFRTHQDGYLTSGMTPDDDHLEFDSVQKAFEFLTREADELSHPYGMECEHDGGASFSVAGNYTTAHGQHSRPDYVIVNAKSGRTNKSIIRECEQLCTKQKQL